jgi:hypothetical protein
MLAVVMYSLAQLRLASRTTCLRCLLACLASSSVQNPPLVARAAALHSSFHQCELKPGAAPTVLRLRLE